MVSSRPQPNHSPSSFGNNSAASSILGAFGRRPRTATNGRDGRSITGPTDYADSSEDLSQIAAPSRSRLSLVSRSGLPRSNSSSHVHRLAFPSSNGGSQMLTTSDSAHSLASGRPQTSGAETDSSFSPIMRSTSSQGNANSGDGRGGNAIGRYLRRYSQGAGKNMAIANEARAIASASNTSNSNARNLMAGESSSGSSNQAPNTQPSQNALTSSVTMPALSSPNVGISGLPNIPQELSNSEGAIASLALINDGAGEAGAGVSNAQTGLASAPGHRIRLVPHLEATRSLHFEPVERDLIEGAIAVKIGRFTDRANPSPPVANGSGVDTSVPSALTAVVPSTSQSAISGPTSSLGVPGARGGAIPSSAGGGGRVDSGRIAFKSKVVSRGHAEVWCEAGGKFFIRDTKSSSGTFLNHIRLSHPNVESKPFPLKDGDVVQLGVDYQGGTEEIYRCVKMRIELNRGWQRGANQFNVNALRQLRALQGSPLPEPGVTTPGAATVAKAALPTNRQSMSVTDCCICLFSVTVCQALFIAPCSHVFHFKCIRPLIEQHHPGFSCPLCRTFADLDADVEEDEAWQQALLREAHGEKGPAVAVDVSTPMAEEPALNLSTAMQDVQPHSAPLSALSAFEGGGSPLPASPRHPSSLRRAVLGVSSTEENGSRLMEQRRRSSASGRSSHRRGSSDRDHTLSSARPDTAVSSSTAVPAAPFTSSLGAHGLGANTSASNRAGVGDQDAAEDEELMYDAPSSTPNSRRPSAPISIRGQSAGSGTGRMRSPPRQGHDGLATSPSFLEARTPQNDHFLSTLAEAPPPSRFSLRAIEPIGDLTLLPGLSTDADRRPSNATNNSSLLGVDGPPDIFSTPAQGNSPPHGSSPFSATVRSNIFDDDGNGDVRTPGSSAAHYTNTNNGNSNKKGKAPDVLTSRDSQTPIDFFAINESSARQARDSSLGGSIESSERGSSGNRSQTSREAQNANTTASNKMTRFFKRSSSAFGN